MNKKLVTLRRQRGKIWANHVMHIQAHAAALWESQQKYEEDCILQLMHTSDNFEDFLVKYRKHWGDMSEEFDKTVNNDEVIKGLKIRYELERSPLAEAMREE